MYRFIRLKKRKLKRNKDITIDLYIREKRNKWDNKTKDKYLNKNKNIIIEGLEGAGKSRELEKIKNNYFKIWKNKKVFYFRADYTLKEIKDKNILEEEVEKFAKENNLEKRDLNKNLVIIEMLLFYFKDCVIIVDDLDKFTGRKLEFLKELLDNNIILVATCKDFNNINKTIQLKIKKRETQIIKLNTKASYDATYVLFVAFILIIIALGQPELAFLVMAGRYMLKGVDNK